MTLDIGIFPVTLDETSVNSPLLSGLSLVFKPKGLVEEIISVILLLKYLQMERVL